MRIVFTKSSDSGVAQSTVLCSGADRSGAVGPDNFAHHCAGQIQPRPRTRADAIKYSHRKNAASEISFSAWREFGSVAAAEFFSVSHPAGLANLEGKCAITNDDGATLKMSDAVIARCACRQLGVSVLCSYTINGAPPQEKGF
jgi:hypothetical protein